MISPDLLAILRCPLDPKHTQLSEVSEGLSCQRCQLVFPIREGIPCMLPEEAKLPPGCASLEDLPCRREAKGAGS